MLYEVITNIGRIECGYCDGVISLSKRNARLWKHRADYEKGFTPVFALEFKNFVITSYSIHYTKLYDYWGEMKEILDWSVNHVTSTLFICWASQAALFHFYGIPKYPLEKKMFGVFKHHVSDNKLPIFRGFDDEFYVPHSRHTEVRSEDILNVPGLEIISASDEAGVNMVMARNGRQIFITGHAEYARDTLNNEYKRDLEKNLPIDIPENYYPDNDPEKKPLLRWRSAASLLFTNWLNYYVYQETPYNLEDIG